MGCTASKLGNEDYVRRCKECRRLMKEAVYARHHLVAAHSDYLRSLNITGSALSTFAAGEPLSVADQTPVVLLYTRSSSSTTTNTTKPPSFHPPPSVASTKVKLSPIFLGERPRGPILGARDEAAPTSPPVTRTYTSTTCEGSNFGGIFGGGGD